MRTISYLTQPTFKNNISSTENPLRLGRRRKAKYVYEWVLVANLVSSPEMWFPAFRYYVGLVTTQQLQIFQTNIGSKWASGTASSRMRRTQKINVVCFRIPFLTVKNHTFIDVSYPTYVNLVRYTEFESVSGFSNAICFDEKTTR